MNQNEILAAKLGVDPDDLYECWQSNALWPPGTCYSKYGDGISTDLHNSKDAAISVCEGLEREGFAGERKVYPIRTWVSLPQDPPKVPLAPESCILRAGMTFSMPKAGSETEYNKYTLYERTMDDITNWVIRDIALSVSKERIARKACRRRRKHHKQRLLGKRT